jgi:hypothetical protein
MCYSFLVRRIIVSEDNACYYFCDISSTMVSKHSKLVKRHARDRYGRFVSPSSRTAPSTSCHEVGSSSRRRTTPPPPRQEEASSDDSVEMWVVRLTAPPLCLMTPPPTLVEEVSFDDSLLSNSSGYNDECPHVKEVNLSI